MFVIFFVGKEERSFFQPYLLLQTAHCKNKLVVSTTEWLATLVADKLERQSVADPGVVRLVRSNLPPSPSCL